MRMRGFLIGFATAVLALAGVVFLGGWYGLLPTTATVAPPGWETAFARHALHAAAARHAGHLPNPIMPTEGNLRAGMKLFRGDCAGCHGSPDQKDQSIGLYPPPTQFATHPPTLPEWQLFWIVRNGVRYSGMFTWGGQWGKDSSGRDVSDEKIWTVVTFLHHLDSLPPSVAAAWNAKQPGEP
jgi:mono/diheme cytochrome c family protein